MIKSSMRRNPTQSKTSQKKTFFLTSTEVSREPSNNSKETREQEVSKRRFASVAKTVLLANRAFSPAPSSRNAIRGNNGAISLPVSTEAVTVKFAPSTSAASNSSEDNLSLCALENDIMMENSFRMEPDELFLTEKSRGIIREVLEAHLKGKSYLAEESKRLSIEISEEIKRKVKAKTPAGRYKLVCVVWIGQVSGQGVHIASRCLWNSRFDNFAQESYKNDHLFAQASVFAVFVE